jgi:predicted transcriptional regulator YdeE
MLPDNILYAVFDIYPIEGYESQNKFMDDWLEKNKDKYEQYKIDNRYFAVEYYGEKFKGNDDIESVVEIWIPIIKKGNNPL